MRAVGRPRLCRATLVCSEQNLPRRTITTTPQSADPSSAPTVVIKQSDTEGYRTSGRRGSPDYIPYKRGYAPNIPLPPGKFNLPTVKKFKGHRDPNKTAPEPSPKTIKTLGIEYERQLHAMRRGYVHWRHNQVVQKSKARHAIKTRPLPPQPPNFQPTFAEKMTTPSSTDQLSLEQTLFSQLNRTRRARGAGWHSERHQRLLSKQRYDLIQSYLALYHTSQTFVTDSEALDTLITRTFQDTSHGMGRQIPQTLAEMIRDSEMGASTALTGGYMYRMHLDREKDVVDAMTGTVAGQMPGFEEVITEIQKGTEGEGETSGAVMTEETTSADSHGSSVTRALDESSAITADDTQPESGLPLTREERVQRRIDTVQTRLDQVAEELAALSEKAKHTPLAKEELEQKTTLKDKQERDERQQMHGRSLTKQERRLQARILKIATRLQSVTEELAALSEKANNTPLTEDEIKRQSVLQHRHQVDTRYFERQQMYNDMAAEYSGDRKSRSQEDHIAAQHQAAAEQHQMDLLRQRYLAGFTSATKAIFPNVPRDESSDLTFPSTIENAVPASHSKSIVDMAADHQMKTNSSFRKRQNSLGMGLFGWTNLDVAKERAEKGQQGNPFPELASVVVSQDELAYLVHQEEFEKQFPARKVLQIRQPETKKFAKKEAAPVKDVKANANVEEEIVEPIVEDSAEADAEPVDEMTKVSEDTVVEDYVVGLDEEQRKVLEDIKQRRKQKRGGVSK